MDHYSSSAAGAQPRNQQSGTSSYENTQLQLGRTLPEEYTEKNLTRSDVDRNQCRLLLPKHFVESILGSMDRTAADQCNSTDGFPIDVLDVDENLSFVLRLKHWATNSYVLARGWWPNFVDRKGLEEGDKVGLTYHGSKLYFRHFENHN